MSCRTSRSKSPSSAEPNMCNRGAPKRRQSTAISVACSAIKPHFGERSMMVRAGQRALCESFEAT